VLLDIQQRKLTFDAWMAKGSPADYVVVVAEISMTKR